MSSVPVNASLFEGTEKDEITITGGANQQKRTGEWLPEPLTVRVHAPAESSPAGQLVEFRPLYSPEKSVGFIFAPEVAVTDSTGIAQCRIKLGNKPGEYGLIVKTEDSHVIANFTALNKKWVFLLVMGLLGGLGLFLLGMNMMSEGMQRSAGEKMRDVLGNLTKNRFVALGLGTFVTMIIQSSSATTVMLVSFVNSGLLKFSQTLGVILGADIGTTVTAQLIALNLTDYALLMIALGFALYTFPKKEKTKHVGHAVLGFGILFFGMHIMSESMSPLRSYTPLLTFIVKLENPLAGILFGTLFTALIQSSAAFIGIMIVFATQGLISLEASIPMLLGANIGTAVTAILSSLNTSRDAKRVALAHVIFKVFGVLVLVWWIDPFVNLVKSISPEDIGADGHTTGLPRQIANAHTLFNVMMTILALPFLNQFSKFIMWIMPARETPGLDIEFQPKYLGKISNLPPSLALRVIKEETIHLAHIVQDMVNNLISPFVLKEEPDQEWMKKKEDEVDFLRDRINQSLMEVTSAHIDSSRTNEAFQIMYAVKEFEQIADIVYETYLETGSAWSKKNLEFSEEGKKELIDFHLQVLKQMSRSIEVFRDVNLEKARHMEKKHQKYKAFAMELERSHYQRILNSVEKSVKTSEIHLDLMTVLNNVYSHSTNIGRIILQWSGKGRHKETEDGKN